MVNSRRLAAVVADALGMPLTSTIQHARNLREAPDAPLIAHGGRGRNVPDMTHEDAATLICAVLGSNAIGESRETVRSLKGLRTQFHGRHLPRDSRTAAYWRAPSFGLEMLADQDVIRGLAGVLRFFDREDDFLRELKVRSARSCSVNIAFQVEYPQHFVSLAIGVQNVVSESWTYGSRAFARTEQIRRCRQDALRDISRCLRTPAGGGAGA